jgi:peptide/nickel transport system substrate-binding protein
MKLLLNFGTVLLVLFAAVSCSSLRTSRGIEPHVLRIADLADPSSLNPLLAHDQETIGNDLLVVQTLIGLDEQNRLVPVLITRIPTRASGDISSDGTRITYHLRHGVRFADGVEMTSRDVDFTYRAILDSRNNVLSQDAYRRIAALQTPDRYTVVIRLKHRWNAAVSDLFSQSDFAFGILPAHAFSGTLLAHADWEDRAFGTGPFHVTAWRRGDRVILAPNPYFSPKPKLQRIELIMTPDGNSAFIALRTHDVDIAALTTPQMRRQARTIGDIRVTVTPENGTEWLSLLTTGPPTSALRIRRAIAYALDMSPIRKTFEGDYPQAGSFLPPVMTPWYQNLGMYPHDLQRARALMGGKSIDAVMVISAENPLWSRIATVVQQELSPAGIRVSIKKYPTVLFNAPEGPIRNARFTLSIDGWLGGADPEQSIVFTCAQANRNGDNISRYCDPRFEALFSQQATTSSEVQRRSDFAQMQQLVHRDLPVVPIYYQTWFDGVSTRVHGFTRNMLQYPVAPETWDTQ